jgi:hypothetical protein
MFLLSAVSSPCDRKENEFRTRYYDFHEIIISSYFSSLQEKKKKEDDGFHTCILGASYPLPEHIAK